MMQHFLSRHLNKLLLAIWVSHIAFQPSLADDNLVAHQLYQQGDYAQAAEIFTDPAWKGVAFYRSNQWWRAAEAFVRAADADSAFNLGNTYVKLGYFELALEAYLTALKIDSEFKDAQHNADVMSALLALNKNQQQATGAQLDREELTSIESETESQGGGGEGEEDSNNAEQTGDSSTNEPGDKALNDAQEGTSGSAANATETDRQERTGNPGGAEQGKVQDHTAKQQPSGSTESESTSDDSQAAGLRNQVESEQATEQWLNLIQHDATLYLERRIVLEQRRRQESGQAAPEGGSSW